MSRSPTAPESPKLIRLRQQTQQTEIKERQALLKEFLGNVKKMVREQAKLYLPQTLDETQRSMILQPQVFLSYAWEAANTPKLTHLHTFLKQLAADLAAAGLTPWLDIQRMTGDLDEQMRSGIRDSQYVLLIGTNRYAERTKPSSDTNVRKELDFTLVEAKKSADFLLPLMLEGDYGTTFPTVGTFLIRDCRSWYSLEQGQWQSQENYIKELTQSEPLGILPCLLGLNRRERHLLKYRQACMKQYGQLQRALMNELALLQKHHGVTEVKSNSSRPSIQLTPVLQIPFKELEYDKEADKIGSGSYGEVYRGWWQGKYSVAIKELTGNLTADAEKDLYREAGIMAHMAKVSTEPYPTVRLFGLAVEKPNYALVMEYVPNGTLFDLLQMQSETKLPWDLRYQLAVDIADGIGLLHRQHILHRDLRSHNILLNIIDGRLRAKLSDFGLSTVKSSVRTHSTVAKKTESVSTRAWMAPELHKRGGQSSPASDIYSYGMVLWELLTHATPFADAQGDSSLITDWVVKDRLTETIPDDCPPKLAELIKKCWAFQPEDRILMDEIQKELAALIMLHPLSPETRAIIETLKKSQRENEEKWNARWQEKRSLVGQKKIEKNQRLLRLQQLEEEVSQLRLAKELKYETNHNDEQPQSYTYPPLPSERKNPASPQKADLTISSSQPHFPLTAPKPLASTEQFQLQDQLIAACKQGDDKAVSALLQWGARPNMPNVKGEQPLGAAVWGMCPKVVSLILEKGGGISTMTWEQCKKHNLNYYHSIFIVSKFDPKSFDGWYVLLQKMDSNLYVRALHLMKADEQWHDSDSSSWESLKSFVKSRTGITGRLIVKGWNLIVNPDTIARHGRVWENTEDEYRNIRSQIQQQVDSEVKLRPVAKTTTATSNPPPALPPASQSSQILMPTPKPGASLEQLRLQDQLIAACKQGDEKAVTALLRQDAKPDMPNAKGEQPLGAAVWGMCPDVVNALLKQAGGVAPLTWDECEKHNQKYYNEVFIVPQFSPENYGQWHKLLKKIEMSFFVRAYHVQKMNEYFPHDEETKNWENLIKFVRKHDQFCDKIRFWNDGVMEIVRRWVAPTSEEVYANYRTQIKQGVESASRPTVEKTL